MQDSVRVQPVALYPVVLVNGAFDKVLGDGKCQAGEGCQDAEFFAVAG